MCHKIPIKGGGEAAPASPRPTSRSGEVGTVFSSSAATCCSPEVLQVLPPPCLSVCLSVVTHLALNAPPPSPLRQSLGFV